MKIYILIVALFFLGCNLKEQNQKKGDEKVIDECFFYPSVIDSLQLRDLYDSARWCVYTWHCDMLYKPKNDSLQSKSFGELQLKFSNLNIKHDTLELNFNFLDKTEPISSGMTIDHKEFLTGVSYNISSKKKISMVSPNGFSKIIKGGLNRYENPVQPEVISYIKHNWDKLDRCFRELAVRKGVTR